MVMEGNSCGRVSRVIFMAIDSDYLHLTLCVPSFVGSFIVLMRSETILPCCQGLVLGKLICSLRSLFSRCVSISLKASSNHVAILCMFDLILF